MESSGSEKKLIIDLQEGNYISELIRARENFVFNKITLGNNVTNTCDYIRKEAT